MKSDARVRIAAGARRIVARVLWRVLRGALLVLVLGLAVSGFPVLVGRRPRPGPPRPQGAVTRQIARRS